MNGRQVQWLLALTTFVDLENTSSRSKTLDLILHVLCVASVILDLLMDHIDLLLIIRQATYDVLFDQPQSCCLFLFKNFQYQQRRYQVISIDILQYLRQFRQAIIFWFASKVTECMYPKVGVQSTTQENESVKSQGKREEYDITYPCNLHA